MNPGAAPGRCATMPDMQRRSSLLGILAAPIAFHCATTRAQGVGPYALPGTTVHDVPDPKTGRKYQLWVDVPSSYDHSSKRFATVLATDAPYAFPLLRSLRNRVGQGGRNIEDFILVGLAPPVSEASASARLRDYSPTDPRMRARPEDSYGGRDYGGAPHYLGYLETVALPCLDASYRTDPSRRVYIGHSYGGLFGAYSLLARTELFATYVLGSPSFWFDRRVIFEIEQTQASKRQDLKARLLMYCGAFETIKPGPRYYKTVDMIGDMQDFADRLRRRKYRSLTIEDHVVADEDHLTVFPNLATRALLRALPGSGPYLSG